MVRTGNPFDQYTSGSPDDFADVLMRLGYSQPINYPIRPYRPPPVSPSTNQTGINLDITGFVPSVETGFVPGTDIGFGGEPQPGDINILTAGLGGNINIPIPQFPEFKGITDAQRRELQSLLESIQELSSTDWGVSAEEATEEYTIEEVDGLFCIMDAEGKKVKCYKTKKGAENRVKKLLGE